MLHFLLLGNGHWFLETKEIDCLPSRLFLHHFHGSSGFLEACNPALLSPLLSWDLRLQVTEPSMVDQFENGTVFVLLPSFIFLFRGVIARRDWHE